MSHVCNLLIIIISENVNTVLLYTIANCTTFNDDDDDDDDDDDCDDNDDDRRCEF